MQEWHASLALLLTPGQALAIEVRGNCRRMRGDFFGARNDYQDLLDCDHSMHEVLSRPHSCPTAALIPDTVMTCCQQGVSSVASY